MSNNINTSTQVALPTLASKALIFLKPSLSDAVLSARIGSIEHGELESSAYLKLVKQPEVTPAERGFRTDYGSSVFEQVKRSRTHGQRTTAIMVKVPGTTSQNDVEVRISVGKDAPGDAYSRVTGVAIRDNNGSLRIGGYNVSLGEPADEVISRVTQFMHLLSRTSAYDKNSLEDPRNPGSSISGEGFRTLDLYGTPGRKPEVSVLEGCIVGYTGKLEFTHQLKVASSNETVEFNEKEEVKLLSNGVGRIVDHSFPSLT